MSIASEITRLQNAKSDIKTSIENKGVVVSSSDKLDDYPSLIDSINISTQVKTVNPQNYTREITPDVGYRGLSKVVLDGVLVDAHDSYTSTTDDDVAYEKIVPTGALKYATLDMLGGMTYKVLNEETNEYELRDSAVTSVVAKKTYEIDEHIQALTGYGWGINDTCYNYIDFENKKFIKKIVRVDLGSFDWSYTPGDYPRFYTEPIADINVSSGNFLCDKYSYVTESSITGNNIDMTFTIRANGRIMVKNLSYTDKTTFKTAMSGVYLYYELATPVETDISQYIDNNFIEVEAGGTNTFNNTYEQKVPSEITYLVEV